MKVGKPSNHALPKNLLATPPGSGPGCLAVVSAIASAPKEADHDFICDLPAERIGRAIEFKVPFLPVITLRSAVPYENIGAMQSRSCG